MGVGVSDVFAALMTAVQEATGLTMIKGYPDWARPVADLPLAALELATFQPGQLGRIGHGNPRCTMTVRIYLFARHELELCALLDAMQTFTGQNGCTLDGQRVDWCWQSAERYAPEVAVQQERHVFVYQYDVTWSTGRV